MPGTRYSLIQKAFWQYLGPAYRGLDADLDAVEAALASGSATSGTDITIVQASNGTWPTITRGAGHYRWFAAYNADLRPTAANGAATGDELVTPSGTVSLA